MTVSTRPSKQNHLRSGKRPGLFHSSALVTGVALAVGGAAVLSAIDANADMPPPQAQSVQAPDGPRGFADVIKQVTPAVVNIAVIEAPSGE